MKTYRYKKVDAFIGEHSFGNPAAYLRIEKDILTEVQMLQIAREHKGFVSEVIFCQESDVADVKLTYYSSEREVEFCGHGTIATMYDLMNENEYLKQKCMVMVETNRKGIQAVYNRLEEEDAIYITAPDPIFYDTVPKSNEVAMALKISQEQILESNPIEIIDAGLKTLIVPFKEYTELILVNPELEPLKKFCEDHEVDIVLVYCKQTSNEGFLAHTRVFAPRFGYLEDTATGSGNSAFANYLLKHKMWDGTVASIEQGGYQIPYNTVKIVQKDDRIWFGGKARVKIEGYYHLAYS